MQTKQVTEIAELVKTLSAISPKGMPAQLELSRVEIQEGGHYEISLYGDEIATPEDILPACVRLRGSFPKMDDVFFNLLSERIVEKKFTAQRLKDAVNYLIDNFQYKELNISDVIRFDKRLKLYTYNDVCCLLPHGYTFNDFERRIIKSQSFWVKKTDLMQIV